MRCCSFLRAVTHAKQRTFVLGFLSAMLTMCLWLMAFGMYMDVTVKRKQRDLDDMIKRPATHTTSLQWQTVKEGRSYALSAFVDRREKVSVVRLVVMERMGDGTKLCLLWIAWRTEPTVVMATYRPVPENHSKDYWIHIYSCPFKENLPLAVSLVYEVTKSPLNIIQVQDLSLNPPISHEVTRDFTVCVAVLHQSYDDVHQLVEAIELNRMFGAQKLVIYDYSVGHQVARFLRYYIEEKLVDVIKWTLPDGVDESQIHYYGQLAAINDCIYRYMYTTKYLLFSDLDEIFVPRKFTNWRDTMKAVVTKTNKHAMRSGAFLLRNAFFPLDCEDQELIRNVSLIKRYNMRSILKTIRLTQLWPQLVRSKYILRPETITVAGVHYMWGFTDNYTHYNITASLGFLHHYRYYLNGCSSWKEDSFMWTKDKFLLRYRREITKRVWRTMAIVGDCPHRPNKPDITKLPW